MNFFEYQISTDRQGLYDITDEVADAIGKSGVKEGMCVVFTTHTTAAVTVNENADPDVVRDFLIGLETAFPDNPSFRHREGNSPAHLKSSCVGVSETIIVRNGRPFLGTWQGIYFCEFDGPRSRRFQVRVMETSG